MKAIFGIGTLDVVITELLLGGGVFLHSVPASGMDLRLDRLGPHETLARLCSRQGKSRRLKLSRFPPRVPRTRWRFR